MTGLVTGELSWRRLGVLVRCLPRDSATVRLQNVEASWTVTDYLLAAATDALHVANWQRQRKKGAPRPRPIPRPGQGPKRYGTAHTVQDMRRILDEWDR